MFVPAFVSIFARISLVCMTDFLGFVGLPTFLIMLLLQNMFAGILQAYVRMKTVGIALGFRQFPAVDLEKFSRMYLMFIPYKVHILQFPTLDLHDDYSFPQFPTSFLQ